MALEILHRAAPCRNVPVTFTLYRLKMRPAFTETPRWPLWLHFVAPAVLIAVLVISDLSLLRELEANSPFVETQGRVVRLDCGNHGNYFVRFEAGGRALERGPASGQFKRNCGDLEIGTEVQVWHSSRNPNYATFISPAEARARIGGEVRTSIFFGYPALVLLSFVMIRVAAGRSVRAAA